MVGPMSYVSLFVGIVTGLAVAWLMFKPLFGDIDGFMEALHFWGTPDVVSAYRGELGEDRTSTFKLVLWLACVGGAAYSVYYGLEKLFA